MSVISFFTALHTARRLEISAWVSSREEVETLIAALMIYRALVWPEPITEPPPVARRAWAPPPPIDTNEAEGGK